MTKYSTSPGFCFTRPAGRTRHVQRRGNLHRFILKMDQKTGSHPLKSQDEPFFMEIFFAVATRYQESSRDAEGIPKADRSR